MEKDYLIEKWLNDDLTPAEMEAFMAMDDYQAHVNILKTAERFKAAHFSKVDDFEKFKTQYESQKTTNNSKWFYPVLRIASIVVVAFALYFSFFNNNTVHIETLAGQKTTIELPDQSEVMLNAGSMIEYVKQDWKSHRELKLNGEAFFKVSKGNTFDVITTDGIVTVVGTQFNVKQRQDYFEVKCFEGIVTVSSDTIVRQLYQGDTFRLLNNLFIEDETQSIEPEWINNLSSFKAIPLSEVLSELERQYDVQIVFENGNRNRLFSGGFPHNNLEKALIAITHPMNMTYEMNSSNQVVIHENNK